MAQSKKVYISPSLLVGFIDRLHPKHDQATAFLRYFAQEQYWLFTDIEVISDTYRQIYHDISPSLAKDFLKVMYVSDINIIYPEENDIKAALKVLVNFQRTELTFLESVSSVIANRRGISQMATFDHFHNLFGINIFFLPI